MEDLVPIEINLNVDPQQVDESFLVTFGFLTKTLLNNIKWCFSFSKAFYFNILRYL